MKIVDDQLETNLYCKPTHCHMYLHADSDYPVHTERAVLYGLGVRIKRICTKTDQYEKHKTVLLDRFQRRGYKRRDVKEQLYIRLIL